MSVHKITIIHPPPTPSVKGGAYLTTLSPCGMVFYIPSPLEGELFMIMTPVFKIFVVLKAKKS